MTEHMTEEQRHLMLRASAQRALLGAIPPRVLGICTSLEDAKLRFVAFVDTPLGEDDHEALEMAASEMLADFPTVKSLEFEVLEESPNALDCSGEWVYVRYGVRLGKNA